MIDEEVATDLVRDARSKTVSRVTHLHNGIDCLVERARVRASRISDH